jgi:hypothetical protein
MGTLSTKFQGVALSALPSEIASQIVEELIPSDIANARLVCKLWNKFLVSYSFVSRI